MSEVKNSVILTLGYSNTEFTRKWKIDGISDTDYANVKSKILAVNASLAAGTDDGLADFFRSDDFDDSDSNNIVGKFTGIVAAQGESYQEQILF